MTRNCKIKLAYLVTHPIHYQSPLLKRLAAEPDIELKVFYQSNCSVKKHFDPGFGRKIDWGIGLLNGFSYRFLPSIGRNDTLSYITPFNYGLGRLLRTGKFNALIVHGYNRPYHWWILLYAKCLGIKIFVRDEATLISKKRNAVNKLLKPIFFGLLNRIITGYLSIGTANIEYYLSNGIGRDRIFLTPYAVDNERICRQVKKAGKNRAALRRRLDLEPHRPIVLYAGKLQARKRALDLWDAFNRAYHRISPPPYLVYVGDGALKPCLLNRIAAVKNDAVRFLGFRNQTELPAFYDLCDVFVLTSFFETWGLVVNEAMAAGKAVIVSDHVGAGVDLVQDGGNGYIVPAGDVKALAHALIKILSDPVRCKQMGKHSARIIQHWSYDQDIRGIRQALGLPTSCI